MQRLKGRSLSPLSISHFGKLYAAPQGEKVLPLLIFPRGEKFVTPLDLPFRQALCSASRGEGFTALNLSSREEVCHPSQSSLEKRILSPLSISHFGKLYAAPQGEKVGTPLNLSLS